MNSKEILHKRYAAMAPSVLKALSIRGYEAYFTKNKEDAARLLLELIPKENSVSFGGSLTLAECNIPSLLKQSGYRVIDRDDAKTPEERVKLTKDALFCDTYLSSVNAMTEDGIMVNIDGMCNRIAAIAFGPESVILVVGMNKICRDTDAALSRARNFAAPANAARLSTDTPCAKTGVCHDCNSPACICSQIVTMRNCRQKGRIKVVLVGEDLGL